MIHHPEMLEFLVAPAGKVEVEIMPRKDGQALYIHIDGETVLKISRIQRLEIRGLDEGDERCR